MAERKELFEYSTQYKHWRFSSLEIKEMRTKVNESEVNVDELQELVQYYMEKTSDVCKTFDLREIVRATAILCMKRFYLFKSVVVFDPKLVMLACVFLAAKIENFLMKIDSFTGKIKGINKDELKEIEFEVAETLGYQFFMYHPYDAGFGIFLDVQTFFNDVRNVHHTFIEADKLISKSMLTDAALIYMPSQIAFACWMLASKQTNLPMEQYIFKKQEKFPKNIDLITIINQIILLIQQYKEPSKEMATKTVRKLEQIRFNKIN